MVSTLNNIRLKYDISDVVFLSSSVKPIDDDCDTSQFHSLEKASVGVVNIVEIEGEAVYFKDNLVTAHTRFDHCNLIRVKYLNLRHSSINNV